MTCRHFLDGLKETRETERKYIRVAMHAVYYVLEARGASLGQADLREIREAVSGYMVNEKRRREDNT